MAASLCHGATKPSIGAKHAAGKQAIARSSSQEVGALLSTCQPMTRTFHSATQAQYVTGCWMVSLASRYDFPQLQACIKLWPTSSWAHQAQQHQVTNRKCWLLSVAVHCRWRVFWDCPHFKSGCSPRIYICAAHGDALWCWGPLHCTARCRRYCST